MQSSRKTGRSPVAPYLALLLLSAAMLSVYAVNLRTFFHLMHNAMHLSEAPFALDQSGRVVQSVTPEGKAGGLQPGDIVESINGHPYSGFQQILTTLRNSAPGTALVVGIRRSNLLPYAVKIQLSPTGKVPTTRVIWAIALSLRVLLPTFCLLLGFWVVLAKPFDRNAWALFFIFAYFGVVMNSGRPHLSFWPQMLYLGFIDFLVVAAFIAIMLFGLNFPHRSSLDKRFPWIIWAVILPLAGLRAYVIVAKYALYYHLDLLRRIGIWDRAIYRIEVALEALCILLFFAGLISNMSQAPTKDARRRLHVLYTGSAVGLLGLLLLFAIDNYTSGHLRHLLPFWLVMVLVLIPLLFPITLAYVVLVQRAMDMRILLRQGTKYAFARGSLWVLQFAFIAAVTYRLARVLHEPRVSRNDIFILLILGLMVLALRYRVARSISTWLDRKFFREAYSTEQLLSELASEVRSFTETRPLLETVTERISRTLHVDRIAVLLNQGGSYQLRQAVGIEPARTVLLPENSSAIRHLLHSHAPARLYNDDPEAWLMLASKPERDALQQLSAELLLPLPGRKKMVGVMVLGPKRSEEPYSHADLQVLQTVAAQTGLAIENTELATKLREESAQRERMNREIEIAREVQERLFPQAMPTIPGGSCAGHCRPAQGVGGDYYDFIALTSGRIGIAVGDVSGKGISAALVMASLRAALHGITLSGSQNNSLNLPALIQHINRLVHDSSTPSRYATFFFGEYDPHTQLLRYVNAGHNPPVVVRPKPSATDARRPEDCEILRLDVGGTVVGLFDNPPYDTGSILLRAGDVLVAFTDGVSEAMNAHDEELGEEKIIEAMCASRMLPADKIMENIFAAADGFTQNAPQHDDMTLAVLARTAPTTPRA